MLVANVDIQYLEAVAFLTTVIHGRYWPQYGTPTATSIEGVRHNGKGIPGILCLSEDRDTRSC